MILVFFYEMRKSTIKLTKHELDFASDTIYPETKQTVMLKMQQLFTACGQKLNQNTLYQELTANTKFKITKGEQYKSLPYMVLDSPQIKGPEIDLVFRTLFWWGHYVSCNLIVSTTKLEQEQDYTAIKQLPKTRLLTGNDLWEQDLDSAEFSKCSALSVAEIEHLIHTQTYVKLSRKIPLRKHAQLPELMDMVYSNWMAVLSIKKGAD